MSKYRITSPDGQTYEINAPDGATQDEVMAYAQKNFKMAATPKTEVKQPEQSLTDKVIQGAANLFGGGLRGAGSVGSTILAADDLASNLSPVGMIRKAVTNKMQGKPLLSNVSDVSGVMERDKVRREDMTQGLEEFGIDRNSLAFKGGKLAGEVAGTAGTGGIVANTARAALPAAMVTKAAPLLNAIGSGGMSTGANTLSAGANMGTRVLGGAISGGASAGLVNPEDATSGAVIGGILPPALAVAGKVGNLARQASSGLVKHTLGVTTGAGSETFSNAYKAGKEGGTAFLDNMRGKVDPTDVIDSAKEALNKMRLDRSNQYRSGMVDIANDKSVIDFAPIDKVAKSLQTMGTFKGQVINKNAAGTVDEISQTIDQWKNLDPTEFHTPEGLDALKKSIGDIRDATQFGTPSRKAADTAYNAIKSQIELQAPTYAKVMKDYSQASQALTEIEKSLSLGNKAAADTSMRKLQSLMRNNVNTNYGNRLNLAKTLEEQGADILPALAGQAASSFTPRGLQGLAASGVGVASFSNPMTLAALPFTSPRLMGEAAYGLGSLNRGIKNVVSRAPLGTRNIGNVQGGLLQQPQELQQFGYQALPVVANNFSR